MTRFPERTADARTPRAPAVLAASPAAATVPGRPTPPTGPAGHAPHRVTLTVRTASGDRECPAAPTPVPGLYVVDGTALWGMFLLAHRSGICIGLEFADPEAALAAAISVGLLIDWDASADVLDPQIEATPGAAAAIVDAVYRFGGTMNGSRPPADDRLAEWSRR